MGRRDKVARASVYRTVREAALRLKEAGVPEPAASAEILMAELLDLRRGNLAWREEPMTEEQAATYEAWIQRRLRREPVQRILGYTYFRNLELDIDEHSLIPRPDTESVVSVALTRIDERGGSCRVLDIGTGSGTIAVSIAQERPRCEVHATDISEGALEVARANAKKAGVRVHLHHTDLTAGLDALRGSVEVLVSNPPYITSAEIPGLAPEVRDWDPRSALDGGPDGLEFYRRIFEETPPLLADGAGVVLEIGHDQSRSVLELGRSRGFVPRGTAPDLTGTPRVALLKWTGGS
ncbi:peptide chain release factor N(5)-glutamine methyltransferase [Rubrobacter marinus]|uniref:Release factor glutamine methyltransferase n=1 Tax=Rubrobacter marinus TaxID=2653852 RepID=A0A6G8PX03_9ACTN|nr:peptide chain release factor N(5)-glutamine methyltransferase [Rubrobacter marinus]QIN78708.1 peptide chain release factor N(5)-glutamine methyltransferase [Rubrobacter marinus]